jgi:hypothetical protein
MPLPSKHAKALSLILLGTAACADDPIRIEGPTNNLPAAHAQSFELFHASKTNGLGYTYNHHVDMACWRGRLYVAWSSAQKDEDTWPWRELYSTSTDGRSWSAPAELFPQGVSTPLRMYFFHAPNGRMLAVAGQRRGETHLTEKLKISLVVREIRADHTLGPLFAPLASATNAADAGFAEACRQLLANRPFLAQQDYGNLLGDQRGPFVELKAPSFFHRKDGALVGIGKRGFTVVSTDDGRSWSAPVQPATLVTGNAKVWGQRTPDGRYALVYNPHPVNRFPLVMVSGDDGVTFRDMRIVNGELPPRRFEGAHKNPGPQYVRGISEWATDRSRDEDGFWIAYSMNKEDIWVSHIEPGKSVATPAGFEPALPP